MLGRCALCDEMADLQASHIIPAFAFRWLRKRSVSSHIRSASTPNRRVQDGDKSYMLCRSCELVFSRYESAFSSQIFKPIIRDGRPVEYSGWLLKFCVSLSWRVLKHCKGKNPYAVYSERQNILAAKAESVWKSFLKGENRLLGDFRQHLLVFTELRHRPPPHVPHNINRYLMGGIEMDIVGTANSLMTFAKIGRFCFFGIIQSPKGTWKGTNIFGERGIVRPGEFSAPSSLGNFFCDRARMIDEVTTVKMSDRQRTIALSDLEKAIERNLDDFLESDHGKAMMADLKLFGEEAVVAKS